MCVSKYSKELKIKLQGIRIQQVKRFTYLGTIVTHDGCTIEDVRTRIALTKKKFVERREVLSGDLNIELRKRLVKCLVWSVGTFGAEIWIVSKEAIRRIDLMKVKWIDRRKDEWILEQIGEEKTMLKMIERRKKR